MDKTQAMKELKAAGTAQNRKVYGRHGVSGPMFGVSYSKLGELTRKIKVDQELAESLWETGNHDARVLATMIADSSRMTNRKLETWAKELNDYVLTDAIAGLASKVDGAKKLAEKWARSKSEWIGAAGWSMIGSLAAAGQFTQPELRRVIDTIESDIHSAMNRVRYSMNNVLIAIGTSQPDLMTRAIATADRIGKVEVDHGETGCKTPDAAAYIKKTIAHQKRKAAKKAPTNK